MKVFAGVDEMTAFRSLASGLKPGPIQLTDVYPGHFAQIETAGEWGIVEIETDRLDQRLLQPEESALEQGFRDVDVTRFSDEQLKIVEALKNLDVDARLTWFRERRARFATQWLASLRAIGACWYAGEVPTRALRRVVVFDPESTPISALCVDAELTLRLHAERRAKYAALAEWLAGGVLVEDAWVNVFNEAELADLRAAAEAGSRRVLAGGGKIE